MVRACVTLTKLAPSVCHRTSLSKGAWRFFRFRFVSCDVEMGKLIEPVHVDVGQRGRFKPEKAEILIKTHVFLAKDMISSLNRTYTSHVPDHGT